VRRGAALVHESAEIHASARLVGPVLIGERSVVGRGSTIAGPTTIGSDCKIGENAMVCRSMVWDRASVGSESFLDRSIVTFDTRIAAGRSCSGKVMHGRGSG